jgi:adenylate kinase
MRVVVTGQVGMDKKAFLQRVVALAASAGREVALFNVGEMMYAEAPDVPAGRILDLPLSRLNALRRSVFKDVLAACGGDDVIVNTHATFRWRHGLFYAFDYDMMKDLAADLYVVLVDNIDRVHARLLRDGHANHTLKDLMVWREEEVLATELLSQIVSSPDRAGSPAGPSAGGQGCFYILARGSDDAPAEALVKLMFARHLKKAYLSFPMSHLGEGGRTLERIARFRAEMKRHFICFDPGDLEEKHLAPLALAAAEAGEKFLAVGVDGREIRIETSELLGILSDIDGQIYARDFKLIDQADMIVSLIPEVAGGEGGPRPVLSSGVERELQHAHEAAKGVFGSVPEAVEFFLAHDYVPPPPAGGLFA